MSGDTVWVVIGDAKYGDGQYIDGVYSTLEKASASISGLYSHYDIEEFVIDERS